MFHTTAQEVSVYFLKILWVWFFFFFFPFLWILHHFPFSTSLFFLHFSLPLVYLPSSPFTFLCPFAWFTCLVTSSELLCLTLNSPILQICSENLLFLYHLSDSCSTRFHLILVLTFQAYHIGNIKLVITNIHFLKSIPKLLPPQCWINTMISFFANPGTTSFTISSTSWNHNITFIWAHQRS